MQTIGIVAEWNPFHNGHRHLIDTIRAETPDALIVGVMSGAFCQRGEVACVDKWTRAEMALANGVDVVLELSQVYATASLEGFAQGGVATLLAFAPLDALYCGSESADEARLMAQATYLRTHKADYDAFIQASSDLSYTEASQRFLANAGLALGKEAPNDRLALHYRLALPNEIPMHLVRREVSHHSDAPQGAMMSASAIRAHLPDALDEVEPYLPKERMEVLSRTYAKAVHNPNDAPLLTTLKVLCCGMSAETVAIRLGIRDGWEHRFFEAVHHADDFSDLLSRAQTRHYTRSRIKRLVLALLSPLPEPPSSPDYIRVLGFSEKGRHLLKTRSKDIPIVLNTAKDARLLSEEATALLNGDIRRQNLADLLCGRSEQNRDYRERPRMQVSS